MARAKELFLISPGQKKNYHFWPFFTLYSQSGRKKLLPVCHLLQVTTLLQRNKASRNTCAAAHVLQLAQLTRQIDRPSTSRRIFLLFLPFSPACWTSLSEGGRRGATFRLQTSESQSGREKFIPVCHLLKVTLLLENKKASHNTCAAAHVL